MSVQDRIQTLKTRHEELDKKLDMENARPMPDEELVRSLKHEKLTLKDEMARMAPA